MELIGVLLAGAAGGFVLGFVGAGGTIVGIPFYLYLAGFAAHEAFGTNALGVAAIGVTLLIARGIRGELQFGPGVLFALPGLVGIVAGTQLGMTVAGSSLVFLLGFVVLIVAGWIFYLSTRTPDDAPTAASTTADSGRTGPGTAARPRLVDRRVLARTGPLGLAVGTVAGFFGVGGGFMIVPGLSWAARIDLKAAAAAALIPITAFAALVGGQYAVAGAASLPLAGVMTLSGVAGGGVGIWLSTRVPTKRFQQAFAAFLVFLGAYMILFQ